MKKKTAQEIAEEIWDDVSYFVDDDISSLDYVANTNVCRGSDFVANVVRAIEIYDRQHYTAEREGMKAVTITDLFDMVNEDNVERLMFDLYKTIKIFVEVKQKPEYKDVKMKSFEFIDDGEHTITFKTEE